MAGETRSADALALEALLVSRRHLYLLFHAALGGVPTAGLLEALCSRETLDAVEEYADDNPSMAGFARFLRGLATKDAPALVEAAADEYTRVFIGPAALPASPYESPYTGKHDTALFQANTLVVRRFFREQGYEARHLMRVPDDHVSLMCDFMAKMGGQALRAFQAGDAGGCEASLRIQDEFVESHLTGWLDVYATAVRNSRAGAKAVLYPQLIEALAAFVSSDRVFCGEALSWLAQCADADGCDVEAASVTAHEPWFSQVEQATDQLAQLQLLGLEDNELVAC